MKPLTVSSGAGTETGDTKINVSESLDSGNHYRYKVTASATAVTAGMNVSNWSIWDGKSDITADNGKVITIVEATYDKIAVGTGHATVVAKA